MRSAPAYPRALRRIRVVVQRVVKGKLRPNFQRVSDSAGTVISVYTLQYFIFFYKYKFVLLIYFIVNLMRLHVRLTNS